MQWACDLSVEPRGGGVEQDDPGLEAPDKLILYVQLALGIWLNIGNMLVVGKVGDCIIAQISYKVIQMVGRDGLANCGTEGWLVFALMKADKLQTSSTSRALRCDQSKHNLKCLYDAIVVRSIGRRQRG